MSSAYMYVFNLVLVFVLVFANAFLSFLNFQSLKSAAPNWKNWLTTAAARQNRP